MGKSHTMSSQDERFTATYRVETPLPLEKAAAVLAGEQSSGTFVAVPGETDELRQRHGARVERITELDSVAAPSMPSNRIKPTTTGPFRRAELVISWPLENVGYNLPTLVSTIQGNLYELSQFTGLKLMDIEVPESFGRVFRGPRFGVEGTRELTGVKTGPMIGTIIKPSVGLSPDQTAALVDKLAGGGIDFIKDDELMADPPHSPFERRVQAIMRVINDHADRTGKKTMYAFNVSAELDDMLRHYDLVQKAGGTGVMVSMNSVGLSAVKKLCDQGALCVHGHRNGWGMLNRHPYLGIEFPAYQKLWRLAGVDQIHVNGIANKFWEEDNSVVRSIESCLRPMLGQRRVLPVISSGQTGLQAPETYRLTKTTDVLYLAGGGIMAHPGGPAAGVTALRQAWDAAVAGRSLQDYAKDHQELNQTLEKFGGRLA
jgi:ribulose-bisphosphate carboxylase large chain